MSRVRNKRTQERGAAILESLLCICLLMFILAGFLQVFLWCVQQIYGEYASYIVSRSRNLGFADYIIGRSGRLAAIGMSGKDLSIQPFPPDEDRFSWFHWGSDYLQHGSWGDYGVYFEYWDSRGVGKPYLGVSTEVPGTDSRPYSGGRVTLYRAPTLLPELADLLNREEGLDITGSARGYDYSHLFLEEGEQ